MESTDFAMPASASLLANEAASPAIKLTAKSVTGGFEEPVEEAKYVSYEEIESADPDSADPQAMTASRTTKVTLVKMLSAIALVTRALGSCETP